MIYVHAKATPCTPFDYTNFSRLIAQLGDSRTLDSKVAGLILTWGAVLCP